MINIITGIPLGHKVGSLVNANSIMHMPNAQVVDSTKLKLVDLNNKICTSYIASNGDYVKILEIFEDKLLFLVSHNLNSEYWKIGYFNLNDLVTKILIRKNSISWFSSSKKQVFNCSGEIIYSLPTTQIVQFLYETQDNKHVCLLFNDEVGNLRTGYVDISEGIFYRYCELPSNLYPIAPKLLNYDIIISQSEKNSIFKVGDLTLNTKILDILNTKNEIIFSSGYSSNLLNFIKLKEGFSSKAYIDSTGHLTIGYGHLIIQGDGFTDSSIITQSQANNLLINDLNKLCYSLKLAIKNNFPNFKFQKTYQLDAILDLAYNNGLIIADNCLEHSIFRDFINGSLQNLQYDFCEWCHGNINGEEQVIFGLYKRKLEDFIIFMTGLYINLPGNNIYQLQHILNYQSKFQKNIWY